MSDRQVDARYSRLQKHIGYRQFINGFTSHSQHTGREHRDLQRDFIAVIAGHEKMTVPVIAAFRSLLEFIYVAQFPIQSQKSLAFMETSLNLFHKHKGAVSATGVRDGKYKKGKFNIKKLELMLGICASTRSVGSALQYSTDQSESLHISMAKVPYRATNKKDFEIQMCRFDDRREKLRLLTLFVENEKHRKLKASKVDSQGNHTGGPARDASGSTPGSGVPANEFAKMFLPPPIRNAFDKDDAPRNTTTAFLLTDRITYGNMKISEVAQMYRLPKLQRLVRGFFGKRKLLLDCWNRVRLQMRSVSQSGTVLPPAVVMAAPPFQTILARILQLRYGERRGNIRHRWDKGCVTVLILSLSLILFSQVTSSLKFVWFSPRFSRARQRCRPTVMNISPMLNRSSHLQIH